jgi:hypothetical protein
MTLENPAPPGDAHVAPESSEILTRLAALQARDEHLVSDRRTALLLAASLARLARAYRRDRDGLLRANLGLQREIQVGAAREHATAAAGAAQADVLARQVVDLKARNEALAAENARLRDAASTPAAPVESKRRWRR